MKLPKLQFWLAATIVFIILRLLVVSPKGEVAWLEYAASEGGGFLLGCLLAYFVQVAIVAFVLSWIWNAIKKE